MQMLSKELDRQDFEAWFVPRFHPRHMHRNKMGNYYFMDADIAWTVWQARSAELLSLREQLAVQKKHSADVLRVADSNGDCMLSWMLQYKEAEHKLNSVRQFIDDECFVIDPEDDENCIRAEYHSKYGELFTAAKPAEE